MKTNVAIVILWAASLFLAYRTGHAVSSRFDYGVPAGVKGVIGSWSESQIPVNNWLRDPRCRQFGRFLLSRPQNPEQAGLYVGLIGSPPFPVIMVSEDAKSKRPREFTFHDAAGNTITALDNNGDGVFDFLGLVTTNGVYKDAGLTGSWKKTGTDANEKGVSP